MSYLGKDTELRQAQAQQGQAIHTVWEQANALTEGQLPKQTIFLIVVGIMGLLWMFRK